MDPLHALYGLVAGIALVSWRLAWLGLVLPVWRVFWKGCVILAAAWAVNRLESEMEEAAYQTEDGR